ncbi:MAG: PQQ-binding-like beta-propeller repeat protein, partial [Firmicutes bacterium]|nr:PQQ-binding-like beta-propeller repeat protein [Bacillota bacterium]
SLSGPPLGSAIFPLRTAQTMSAIDFGSSTEVSPANGVIYTGSGQDSVEAVNALTGKTIWKTKTFNGDTAQPLVFSNVVVVSSGDPWMNFMSVQEWARKDKTTRLGASFQALHGFNPETGAELWTRYTRGSDMMTPAAYDGNLYWVNGSGSVWAINAQTGQDVAPFVQGFGHVALKLGGFNAVNAGAVVMTANNTPVLLAGTSNPAMLYGIDLNNDTVLWQQSLASLGVHGQNLSVCEVTPAVDTAKGLMIADVVVKTSAGQAQEVVYALNDATGRIVWQQAIGSGAVFDGFTGAVPMIHDGVVYVGNPLNKTYAALNVQTGAVLWSASVGVRVQGPGAAIGTQLLIAGGPNVLAVNAATGQITQTTTLGGDFLGDGPVVVGGTVYLGNSYGWVLARPVAQLLKAGSS